MHKCDFREVCSKNNNNNNNNRNVFSVLRMQPQVMSGVLISAGQWQWCVVME